MIVFLKAHPATQAMSRAATPADLNEGDIRRNPGEPDADEAAAGEYTKPRFKWRGLTIAVENPAGSVRRGRNRHGVTWEVRMRFDYGEILDSVGVDGDPVDVIVGPNLDAPEVYVVHQRRVNDWDNYDEDKVCVGFDSQSDAEQAFLSNYNDPRFLGPITAMPVDEFVTKVRATKDKPAMIKALLLKTHVAGYTKQDGTFVPPHEDKRQSLQDDLQRQEKWLHSEAVALGYSDIEDMLEKDYPAFERLALQWREQNPVEVAMKSMVLFFKSYVGAYVRGGRMVQGYQGRAARAAAMPGQMALFGEPQHTEPTKELVAEHERLVDVLNSPSHADDKVEAKKQAGELADMKQEVQAPAPSKTQQTVARRRAALDVLGEGWKAQAGVDGARDAYKKVITKPDGGKLQLMIMPEKTVTGNFYVGCYNLGGSRPGAGSNDSSAKTIEEAKAIAERMAAPAKPVPKSEPDAADRANPRKKYYVTMIREGNPRQVARLAGPFDQHEDALAHVDRARSAAHEVDPRSAFDAFGTAGVEADEHRPGVLNGKLGIKPNERQSATETPQFKRWFGDSKVVASDGKPLTVYHGTPQHQGKNGSVVLGDISEFDRLATVKRIPGRKSTMDNIGSWFSTNPGVDGAGMYAGNGAIYPVHLSIKNPYVTTFADLARLMHTVNGDHDKAKEAAVNGRGDPEKLREWLAAKGHDGIKITHDPKSFSQEFSKQDAWIALDPTQIKSATGNNGDFDPANPEITKSMPIVFIASR